MSKWEPLNPWYSMSKDKDTDFGEDNSSGISIQPDHYPNVARPGGGYPEGKGHKTDAFCNKCKDQLIDGSCLRCDWGPQNRSVPVKNFPLDPFRDDKAGIRAASWKFATTPKLVNELAEGSILNKSAKQFYLSLWREGKTGKNVKGRQIPFEKWSESLKLFRQNEQEIVNFAIESVLNSVSDGNIEDMVTRPGGKESEYFTGIASSGSLKPILARQFRLNLMYEGAAMIFGCALKNSFLNNLITDGVNEKLLKRGQKPIFFKQTSGLGTMTSLIKDLMVNNSELYNNIETLSGIYADENKNSNAERAERKWRARLDAVRKISEPMGIWIARGDIARLWGRASIDAYQQALSQNADLDIPPPEIGFKLFFGENGIEIILNEIKNVIIENVKQNESILINNYQLNPNELEVDEYGWVQFKGIKDKYINSLGYAICDLSIPEIFEKALELSLTKGVSKRSVAKYQSITNLVSQKTERDYNNAMYNFVDRKVMSLPEFENIWVDGIVKATQLEKAVHHNRDILNDITELSEATNGNEKVYALYPEHKIIEILNKKYKFDFELTPGMLNRFLANHPQIKRAATPTTFTPLLPGYLYAYELEDTMTVGVTNNPISRHKEYLKGNTYGTNAVKKIDPSNRINIPALDVLNTAPEECLYPSLEESQEIGISSEKYNLKDYTRTRPKERPKKKTAETNEEELPKASRSWCSSEINQGGNYPGAIAERVEKNLLKWFRDKGYGVDYDSATRSESITKDPEKVRDGLPAPESLTFDLVVFLIQKMIENNGYFDFEDHTIFETMDDQDIEDFLDIFDNNPESMFDVFGTERIIDGKPTISTDPVGMALGLDFRSDENGKFYIGENLSRQFDGKGDKYIELGGEIPKSKLIDIGQDQVKDVSIDKQKQIQEMLQSDRLTERAYYDLEKYDKPWFLNKEALEYALQIYQYAAQLVSSGGGLLDDNGIWQIDPNTQQPTQLLISNNAIEILNQYAPERIKNINTEIETQAQINNTEQPVEQVPSEPMQSESSTWKDITKHSDYEGWTNWETWNTKLMIDNEQATYEYSKEIIKQGGTAEDLANWATVTVIGPHNQQAIADAQEWNEIPYDERPTGREDISEGARDALEGLDEIFGMDPRSDETARVIDESLVNWNEIYDSIKQELQYNEQSDHEDGDHDLLVINHMQDFTAKELAEEQARQFPLCPLCNVDQPEDPDAPGDTTLPEHWGSRTADFAAGEHDGWKTPQTNIVYDNLHSDSKVGVLWELLSLFEFEENQTMPSENGKLSIQEFTDFLLKYIVGPFNQFLITVDAGRTVQEDQIDWPSLYKVMEQEAVAEQETNHNELHVGPDKNPAEFRLCPICNPPQGPANPDAPGDTTIPEGWS